LEYLINAEFAENAKKSVPIPYKDVKLGTDLRLDLLVEDKVVVDLKE
jgi:GxxExxY protein